MVNFESFEHELRWITYRGQEKH